MATTQYWQVAHKKIDHVIMRTVCHECSQSQSDRKTHVLPTLVSRYQMWLVWSWAYKANKNVLFFKLGTTFSNSKAVITARKRQARNVVTSHLMVIAGII